MTGLKKRQQIKKANNTMFLWVIAASVAVTICLVFGQFLFRQFMFNTRIYNEKAKTESILKQNKATFETIKGDVNKLLSNQSLAALKAAPEDTPLQVIVDALPTSDDRAALGTSLQQVVLSRSGVSIESMSVTDGGLVSSDTPASDQVQEIPFSLVLIGTYDQVAQAVADMERSIRPIKIDSIQLDGSGARLRATIAAKTFYLPAKSVELKKEAIKP